jgi:hypothetical protein
LLLQMRIRTVAGVGWVALATCLGTAVQAQGIYSCVDGKGRKITADRPIPECNDRAQREINPSGTVKRVVGPTLTAAERSALEEKEKLAAEARAREAEEKRRDRALLSRYPSRAVHDKERAEALEQIEVVIKAASKRATELATQRKAIDADLEFYKADPGKAPASLKRRLEENDSSAAVQKRFIADQDAEKKRVNMRFDEELTKLNQLWRMAGGNAGADTAAAATATVKK